MLNVKKRMLLGLILMLLVLASIGVAILTNMPDKPPLLNGILLPEAVVLNEFSIQDHHNNRFTNKQLQGKWHLVSYGYTHCPDICPTTLAVLSRVSNRLKNHQFDDLTMLFYSIDHRRDTVAHLAEYIPHFNEDFIGLTYEDSNEETALPFETSLGMISILTPVSQTESEDSFESYTVSHGFMLYIINPEGKLQAVLKPMQDKNGNLYFTEQQILDDYLAIRNYLG